MSEKYLPAEWPVPAWVRAWQTTRAEGFSHGDYAGLNLSIGVGDELAAVQKNRKLLQQGLNLPDALEWIHLVHGNRVVDIACKNGLEDADALYTNLCDRVLIRPTADCMPVLFCSKQGDEIAAAHAGWRGLSAGILENTLSKFTCSAEDVTVWLGPAIGAKNFEVGEDVLEAFQNSHPASEGAFFKTKKPGKYLADIISLARLALTRAGVRNISGGNYCTFEDKRFFSYRRQGKKSGRMASLIWIKGS